MENLPNLGSVLGILPPPPVYLWENLKISHSWERNFCSGVSSCNQIYVGAASWLLARKPYINKSYQVHIYLFQDGNFSYPFIISRNTLLLETKWYFCLTITFVASISVGIPLPARFISSVRGDLAPGTRRLDGWMVQPELLLLPYL